MVARFHLSNGISALVHMTALIPQLDKCRRPCREVPFSARPGLLRSFKL